MKKNELKILKDKAWEALSRWKRFSIMKCMRCNKPKDPKTLHAHHIVPKSHGNYARFEEDNIVVLCFYCHRNWWHGDSTWEEQRDLIDKWIGLERYEQIKIRSNQICKYTAQDYKEMITKWRSLHEESAMKGGGE